MAGAPLPDAAASTTAASATRLDSLFFGFRVEVYKNNVSADAARVLQAKRLSSNLVTDNPNQFARLSLGTLKKGLLAYHKMSPGPCGVCCA